VDTKYLATHAEGDLNASPTLQEIAEGLANQPLPSVVTHPEHSKYQEKEAFHEAGYDSLLTATVMIRLAAKLGAASEKHSAQSDQASGKATVSKEGDVQDSMRDGHEKVLKSIPLPPVVDLDCPAPITSRQKRKKKRKHKLPKETEQCHFNTKNMFDSLREMSINSEDDAPGPDASSTESEAAIEFDDAEASMWNEQPAAEAGSWQNDIYVQDKTGWVPIEQNDRHAMEFIPKWQDAEFWGEYGNTLRVFGTQEAVLRIANEW
jgi:poly(A)-specific ribonuclease